MSKPPTQISDQQQAKGCVKQAVRLKFWKARKRSKVNAKKNYSV